MRQTLLAHSNFIARLHNILSSSVIVTSAPIKESHSNSMIVIV